MSEKKNDDFPRPYILIDATKYTKKHESKKVKNSPKSETRKRQVKTLYCALCGLKIPYGGLLKHKELAHGEKVVPRSAQTDRQKNLWVKFVPGGLPSLGKRK
jgi:hypothetical protein